MHLQDEAGLQKNAVNLRKLLHELKKKQDHGFIKVVIKKIRDVDKDARAKGISSSSVSRFMSGKQNFKDSQVQCLWGYIQRNYPGEIAQLEAADRLARTKQSKSWALVDRARELGASLMKFYAMHEFQLQRLNTLHLAAYYHVFKYSYRRHDHIVKSAAVVLRPDAIANTPFLYLERQINADKQREDTVGVLLSKSYRPWIFAQEIDEEQIRIFIITAEDIAFDSDADARSQPLTEQKIQCMYGFSLEGYAKFDSHVGAPKGGFISPVALQRISDAEIKRRLKSNTDHLLVYDNIDRGISAALRGCYLAPTQSFLDDPNVHQRIKNHMTHNPWSDSALRIPVAKEPSRRSRTGPRKQR